MALEIDSKLWQSQNFECFDSKDLKRNSAIVSSLFQVLRWRSELEDDAILQEVLSLPKLKVFSCCYKNQSTGITEEQKDDLKEQIIELKDVECIILDEDSRCYKKLVTSFICF